ncbi:P-loop containing nucleoside triphosphate hydrolase protein [Gloeopeniophorella convolvens]|nr:P-loop containing nucleoside triphosphate hydrolase protein [Gloeopeniophorella convolvens]
MLQDLTHPPGVEISLVGDMSVGKSALIMRLCDNLWQPEHLAANIGLDLRTLLHNVNGKRVKLRIWDTAGQERFRAVAPTTYRRAQAIIVGEMSSVGPSILSMLMTFLAVYSIMSRETFDVLPKYIKDIETYAHPEAVKIVVGNVLDVPSASSPRAVPKAEAAKFAADNRCLYTETSAMTSEGVTIMFNIVIECVLATPALSDGRFGEGMSGVGLFTGPTPVAAQPANSNRGCMC